MASTRFPKKPFASIKGRSMVERVWRIAKSLKTPCEVVVATDDIEPFSSLQALGAEVLSTPETCQSGSDRAAFVMENLGKNFDIVVSLQGDAVLTPPWVIDDLLRLMQSDSKIQISTPAIKLEGKVLEDFLAIKKKGSSTGTTVTFDMDRNALYFSKAVIPNIRNHSKELAVYRHIGTYAYRADALRRMTALPQSNLEKIEGLEQLRALENKLPIRVLEVDYKGRTHASVDNPEDIAIVEKIIEREGELV